MFREYRGRKESASTGQRRADVVKFCLSRSQVLEVHIGSQQFALHVEDKRSVVGVPVRHFRGVGCAAVGKDLVGLPPRVGLVQDVQDGGLHVAQHKLALVGLDREEESRSSKNSEEKKVATTKSEISWT